MLSVQPLKSAQGAVDYYTSAYNYYVGDAQAMRWLGRGSEILGLREEIEKEQMLKLLEGKLPDGQVLQNKLGKHRPGFDMTFSAPKSVSILIGLGFDKELEQLHDRAVEKTIGQLEEEFAETRIVKDGEVHFEKTNNFVIAAFRQPTSRANEPAVHTHGVTMNMTFDSKGKVRSLASDIHGKRGVVEQLQRNITYAGLLYRTNLANLMKEKNYPMRDAGDGLFEIEGMSKELLKEFSTRREDIIEYMDEKGWSGASAASAATVLTREDKEEYDLETLRVGWLLRAEKHGFDGHKFVEDIRAAKSTPNIFERFKSQVFAKFFNKEDLQHIKAREAVSVAIETISQKSSVFEARKLKEYALKHTLTGAQIVTSSAIDKVIEEKIQDQSLYTGFDPYTKQSVLTTPWLLTVEAETLARIENNKGVMASITSKKEVIDFQKNHELNARFQLTPSQRQAMLQFLTNTDRYMAIQGYAGVGKTTLLNLTREVAENQGFKLRGIAVTSSAANELNLKAKIQSDVFPIVHSELLRANSKELEKTIFIVDEASMLSSPQGHELIKLIEQKNARLYLVGDDSQFHTVKNGRIFGLSQEYGIQKAVMTDNIRQKNQQLKEAVMHTIQGEVYDAVQKINEVRVYKSHDSRVEHMANSYLDLSEHVRENTLLFAPTHKNRREITQIIREGLKKEGSIDQGDTKFTILKNKALEEAQLYYTQYYEEGDVIRFNMDAKRLGIQKGDYLTVAKIDTKNKQENSLRLIRDDLKEVKFKLNDLPIYQSTRAGFKRHIEVYKQDSIGLSVGDRILWTRNFKQEGISNSERAKITSITDNDVALILDNGETKVLPKNHNALKHLDHGYVFTTIKVQGKDKMYGIGLMESHNEFSATLKNFMVQISRAISNMKLVTDDKDRLVRALELNDDVKKSAIDFVTGETLSSHQERFANTSKAINIDSVIEKKIEKDELMAQKECLVQEYKASKEALNTYESAKNAHAVVSDPKAYRMALSTLSYGYQVYKEDAVDFASRNLRDSLPEDEQKKLDTVRLYIESKRESRKDWKKIKDEEHQKIARLEVLSASIKRDKCAYQISKDIEAYKPYLKHYSIGALNRLGVPQHRYNVDTESAVKNLELLTSHAVKYELYTKIDEFFTSPDDLKPDIAYEIKSNSKIAHPYIIKLADDKKLSPSDLWKEINFSAREHQDLNFKQKLSAPHQKVFEQIKAYKSLNLEIGRLWSENVIDTDNKKTLPKEIKDKIRDASNSRNEIAAIVIKDLSALPVLAYFKLDLDKLDQQNIKYDAQKNVEKFINSKSNFRDRLLSAKAINEDIKGHYLFIKENAVNTKELNKYIRFIARKEHMATLSSAEVADYKTVLDYKHESRQATNAWKKIFAHKENGIKPHGDLFEHAFLSTAKRDALAYKIHNQTQYNVFLEREHLSTEKLENQNHNHQSRLSELVTISTERGNLLAKLEQFDSTMPSKDAQKWHGAWDELNGKAIKLSNSGLYQESLKEIPLGAASLPKKYRELLNKYDLNTNDKPVVTRYIENANSRIDSTITNEILLANPETTYHSIFGEPKSLASKEMRYPGGLIVSLKGSKAGLWFDFGSGKGGGPIQAIMHEEGLDFKEALVRASKLAGTYESNHDMQSTSKAALKQVPMEEHHTEIKQKIKSAQSIMKNAIPTSNTLAERYLKEHRHIENPERLNMRFLPKGAKWLDADSNGKLVEKVNKIPALVIPARNEKGDVTGVQRIYLDENTANKNTFMKTAKFSKGQIQSSAGVIQKGDKQGLLYIAEGPETGASIAMANPSATVLVSFGISNIQNLAKIIKNHYPKEVIIAGDNDSQSGSKTLELTQKAANNLKEKGIQATVIIPKQIDGFEKTDWNDVLKIQGISELRRQLHIEDISGTKNNAMLIDNFIKDEKHIAIPSNILNDRFKDSILEVRKDQELRLQTIEKTIQNNNIKLSEQYISVSDPQKPAINIKPTKELTLEI
ncbi:MAG: MobF family relaxase [Gammaproteobacteria bacterium]